MEHKQTRKQEPSEGEYLIGVRLEFSHFPAVFDLSLTYPLDLFLQIKRGQFGDEDQRSMTFLTTGSVLDTTYALSTGLLQLTDAEDKTVIDFKDIGNTTSAPQGPRASSGANIFVTVSPRWHQKTTRKKVSKVVSRRKYDLQLPLELPTAFKDRIKAGHKYRLEMVTTDLNIRWWNWGLPSELGINNDTAPENLPQSETAKLVSSCHHVDFSVVESFPTPPPLTIKLLAPPFSPHPNATSADGNEKGLRDGKLEEQHALPPSSPITTSTTEPRFLISITNMGTRPITVKSNLEQMYITSVKENPNHLISSDPRITCQHRQPGLRSFSIMDTTSTSPPNEVLTFPFPPCCAPPNKGLRQPQNFTTLEPGVPIITAVDFSNGWLVERMSGRRCVLTLRPTGAWWIWGSVEEVFEKAKGLRRGMAEFIWLNSRKPPLMLECEDQLVFELPPFGWVLV